MMRLARDTRGNILAMCAAAMIPIIGLVGGALDAARLYATRARLQSACDAGALAGRRVMGTARWADNGGRANTIALQTFDLNFPPDFFGSENRSRTFTETDGTVSGSASTNVPMTLMRVFNMPTETVTVTCEGQMRIPNTDVMFVLDNSGSMRDVIQGDPTGLRKMDGLHRAIRCFYEALARTNITDVTPQDCGATADPTGDLSTQVQLRFGFVNYDNMVNVGKLLPNDFLVDRWTYQSRQAQSEVVQTWVAGTQGTATYTPWSAIPDMYSDPQRYSSTYAFVATSGNSTLANGTFPRRVATATTTAACNALNTFGSYRALVGYTETNGTVTGAWVGDTPVYPAPEQNMTITQKRTQAVTAGFRYRYFQYNSTTSCWLERAAANIDGDTNKYEQTRNGAATKPVTWTPYTRVTKWTYTPQSFDVSPLKAGGSAWNNSVTLPVGRRLTAAALRLSGSSVAAKLEEPVDANVEWAGCIEERQTFRNVDGVPGDDWLGYPSTPADALDMDIDLVPSASDPRTQWRPLLTGAVWGRRATLVDNKWIGDLTNADVESASSILGDASRNLSGFTNCVTPSRKLTSYNGINGNPDAAAFSNYVGTIEENGNTYHDIGLLWGARLMSPTGIFASENALTPGGAQIQRHMIFMTDGATANTYNNYASYGLEWWDRRQLDPNGLTTAQYEAGLVANNNARSNALCTAIKNKNITLWVIFYGPMSDTATRDRLTACATSSTYFFHAGNTTALIIKFREIADRISNLRLTQ